MQRSETVDLESEILNLERRFWIGGIDVYRESLADDALMAFPGPAGLVRRDEILHAVGSSPRWSSVAIQDATLLPLGDDGVVLTYRALGRRDVDGFTYPTLAASVYRRVDGDWKLVFHQQTPAGPI